MTADDPRDSRASWRTFHGVLAIAAELAADRHVDSAAIALQIAAEFASHNHPGTLASPEAERLVAELGRQLPGTGLSQRARVRPPESILHVMTRASAIGGTTRTVANWIRQDRHRRHTVALTSQRTQPVPDWFSDAVRASGGTIHILDAESTRLTARATRLRAAIAASDFVDLIPIPFDIVPLLAVAGLADRPPVVLVDHCDHMFWLGGGLVDAVAHMRQAGTELGRRRRGIPAERQVMLPVPIEPRQRTLDRVAAKAALGIPADAILMLTVARGGKYRPIQEPGFFDLIDRILHRHPQARLLAVGPQASDPWIHLGPETRARVATLGEVPATPTMFEAADIYLDSFPFASNTSLMEAGLAGVPLVCCCRFPAEADVMHPGAPGLDGTVVRTTGADAYVDEVSALIVDDTHRRAVAARIETSLTAAHCGEGWQGYLEAMYAAVRPGASAITCAVPDADHDSPLTVALRELGLGFSLAGIVERHLAEQPAAIRVPVLRRLRRLDASCSRSLFLPPSMRSLVRQRTPVEVRARRG